MLLKKEVLVPIKENPLLSVSFMIFLLFFIISPYYRGMFFYEDRYLYYIIVIGLLLINILAIWKKYFDTVKSNIFLFIIALLIPTMYFISYLLNSVSKHYGMNEVVYWISSVSVFFYVLTLLSIQPKFKTWLWWVIWSTISWIVTFSFLAHLNIVNFTDAIIQNRFASVFQYPNTFASLVSAFVLAALYMLVKEKNKNVWFIYSLTVLPFLLSFLMTESRGGYLVFALCWTLTLFFLKIREQIIFVCYSALAGALTLATLIIYQSQIDQSGMIAGLFLIVGMLVFTVASFGVKLIFKRSNKNQQEDNMNTTNKLKFLIPLGIIVIIVVGTFLVVNSSNFNFLPENLQDRISNINFKQHSVQERLLFYKDSMTILGDYTWFGAGGGAWRSLFEQYKSLPYSSTQAHSFYMQTLIEVGVIGGAIVFIFFFIIIFQAIRTLISTKSTNHNKVPLSVYLLIVVTLMLHNFIDFNMSYATYHYFIMVFLALMVIEINHINQGAFQLPKLNLRIQGNLANTILAITLLLTVLGAYKSYAFINANGKLQEASYGGDYNQINNAVNEGIKLDPTKPELRYYRIELLNFAKENMNDRDYDQDIREEYQKLLSLEPAFPGHYTSYGQFELLNGNEEKSLELFRKAIVFAPWSSENYMTYLSTALDYIINNRDMLTEAEIQEHISGIIGELERFNNKLKEQESDIPEGLNVTHPIVITSELAETMAKAYYYTGQFEEGLAFMEERYDMDEVGESMHIEAQVLKLLTLDQLGRNEEVEQILATDQDSQIGLKEYYEQVKENIWWQPFTN